MQCTHDDPYLSEAEKLVNNILSSSAQSIKVKYGIYPSGVGAAMPSGVIQILTLAFDTKIQHSKEGLRQLLIKSAYELLNQVNANDNVQSHLINSPFTLENVQIIIYNKDNNRNVGNDPIIATAEISDGILTYRTIDPEDTFKFKNRFTESYAEAIKVMEIHENI